MFQRRKGKDVCLPHVSTATTYSLHLDTNVSSLLLDLEAERSSFSVPAPETDPEHLQV